LTGAVLVAFEASLAVADFLGSLLALALMSLAWTGVSLGWAGVGEGGLDKVGGDGFFRLVEVDFDEEDEAAAEDDFEEDAIAEDLDFDEEAGAAAEDLGFDEEDAAGAAVAEDLDFDEEDDAAAAESLDFEEEDAAGAAALAEAEVLEEDNPSNGGTMIAFAMAWYSMEASLRTPRNMLDRLERRADPLVSDESLTSTTTSLMAMLDVESSFASPASSSSFSSRFLL